MEDPVIPNTFSESTINRTAEYNREGDGLINLFNSFNSRLKNYHE